VARLKSAILCNLGFGKKEYCLATIHRAYNTDSPRTSPG